LALLQRHNKAKERNEPSKSLKKFTPVENQSPSGVGVTRDLIASTIETAVDAAEDLPHFWMSTPPRCIIIGMNARHHVCSSKMDKLQIDVKRRVPFEQL
jgi:hypothetical protein